MKKEWDTTAILRQVRHDWLNKMQLIKGNLDLNKIDRARMIIEEIVIEAQNEAKLSNLNIPHLTSLLLTHNWENTNFQLEFEVINDQRVGSIDDDVLTNWTSLLFEHLNGAIKQYEENHLSISIEPQHQGVCFFFDFSGIIENIAPIEQFLQGASFGIRVERYDISKVELTLEVFIPYKSVDTSNT